MLNTALLKLTLLLIKQRLHIEKCHNWFWDKGDSFKTRSGFRLGFTFPSELFLKPVRCGKEWPRTC